jgi:3-deoxy-7-phosphoheptulonate synthase
MISAKIGLILSFSLILVWGQRLPVVRAEFFMRRDTQVSVQVRIGRIAGQYAKPRSSAKEKLPDGREVLSFR